MNKTKKEILEKWWKVWSAGNECCLLTPSEKKHILSKIKHFPCEQILEDIGYMLNHDN